MYQLFEIKSHDSEPKSLGVYGEEEKDTMYDDWDMWLGIAETSKSCMKMYHNGALRSTYDQRETP
jgi:hypothetical protein